MGSREIVIPKIGNVGRYGLGPGSRIGPNVGGGNGGGGGKGGGNNGGGNGFKGGGFPPGNSGGGGGNFNVDTSTVALLHFDGTNGSTTFTNEVAALGRGTTWSAGGTGTISTAQSQFGGASYLSAAASYAASGSSADHTFGSGDFTIAGWFRPTNITTTQAIFYTDGGVNGNLIIDTNSVLEWRTSAATILTIGLVNINAWNHFAVTRTKLAGTNTEMLFLNGVLEASGISIASLTGTSFRIGLSFAGLAPFLGNIDDVIFKKGRCLYTQTFTPPTAPYDP